MNWRRTEVICSWIEAPRPDDKLPGTRCEIATTLNIEVDNYKSSLTVRVNGLIKILLTQINVRRQGPHAHIFSNWQIDIMVP